MLRHAMIVVALTLGGAGCSDSGSGAEPEPAAANGPTTTADDSATVSQWASLVATHERDWRDQVEQVEEDCLDPATLLGCVLGYETLSLKAQTIELVVDGAATNPDVDHYLGEPPAEINTLVDSLIEAAGAVEPAVSAWQDTGCDDPLSLGCGVAESFAMDMAVGDLTEAFDAWAPYL